MIEPIPSTSFLSVREVDAEAWFAAAAALPPRDPRALYEPSVQASIRDAVRRAAPRAFAELVHGIDERLRAEPHLVVVRGLRWDEHDHVCIALNAGFGVLVAGRYLPPRSQIVHRLQVRTELPGRQGAMSAAETFHSDCVTQLHPAELLTMVCLRPDLGGGGSTRVVTTAQVRRLILERGGEDRLRWFEQTPLPWRIADPADGRRYTGNLDVLREYLDWRGVDPRGEGVVERSVLDGDRLLWRRDAIEHAFGLLGGPPDAVTAEHLDFLEKLLEDPPEQFDCPLVEGDFMVADNLRTLHNRTPLTGDYASSDRLLLRCWVRRATAG